MKFNTYLKAKSIAISYGIIGQVHIYHEENLGIYELSVSQNRDDGYHYMVDDYPPYPEYVSDRSDEFVLNKFTESIEKSGRRRSMTDQEFIEFYSLLEKVSEVPFISSEPHCNSVIFWTDISRMSGDKFHPPVSLDFRFLACTNLKSVHNNWSKPFYLINKERRGGIIQERILGAGSSPLEALRSLDSILNSEELLSLLTIIC